MIGIDFDNTLVRYDAVMCHEAERRGLLVAGAGHSKREIRDQVRQGDDGEQAWQQIQATVYASRMPEAACADGVESFFARARTRRIPVKIVSHKTMHAHADGTTNLREAAMAWMRAHRFFDANGLGLSHADVFFESTRDEKIARIRQLGCTHFIDDLEETFAEAAFPHGVAPILYAPHGHSTSLPRVRVMRTWEEISDYLFGS